MSAEPHQLEIELNEAVTNDDIEKVKELLANPEVDVNFKIILFCIFLRYFQLSISFMEFDPKDLIEPHCT